LPEKRQADQSIVDARPTKEFFISMLTKDIELTRSIIDLVDNALDGARRLRKDHNYKGLFVKIEATRGHFKIVDNCGGIDIDLAREHAFRFGRPTHAKSTSHSVGQFGVGLKRALFKLGKKFFIRSDAPRSWFELKVDVDEWKKDDVKWEFEFDDYRENLAEDKNRDLGTSVTVTSLHPSVREAFGDEKFQTRLAREIKEAHTQTIERGLQVSLDGIPLGVRPLLLLQSDELKPALHEMRWGKGRSEVTAKLYAGIAQSEPSEAGWNIFCNGRLVLGADQTLVTGWGEAEGKVIPHFHPQYNRFRGFVFLDSDDTSSLPWNTTKTGVDTDSPHYKSVRVEMIKLMRPVIDFLNDLSSERKAYESEDRVLQAAVMAATAQNLTQIQTRKTFKFPEATLSRVKPPELGRISYIKPLEEIARVKKKLKVSAMKQVGEKTFEYFYKRECEE
jgi:hypothetical protein